MAELEDPVPYEEHGAFIALTPSTVMPVFMAVCPHCKGSSWATPDRDVARGALKHHLAAFHGAGTYDVPYLVADMATA